MMSREKLSNKGLKMIRLIVSFFWGSLAGVSIDLIVFQTAVYFGLSVFNSNLISSSLAVIITYLLVTQYTFRMKVSSAGFMLFAGWYVCSITIFSMLITYVVNLHLLSTIACKLLSLPFSFTVNFLFSRIILVRSKLYE